MQVNIEEAGFYCAKSRRSTRGHRTSPRSISASATVRGTATLYEVGSGGSVISSFDRAASSCNSLESGGVCLLHVVPQRLVLVRRSSTRDESRKGDMPDFSKNVGFHTVGVLEDLTALARSSIQVRNYFPGIWATN